jgi:hypothetical protein
MSHPFVFPMGCRLTSGSLFLVVIVGSQLLEIGRNAAVPLQKLLEGFFTDPQHALWTDVNAFQ